VGLDRAGGGAISALEEALTLVPADAGTWTANADPRFESINGMFGGWAAAVLLRATLQRPDEGSDDPWTPVAITVNFLGKVEPGTNPVVSAEAAGGGRSLRHWQARLLGADDDRVLASAMVILARRAESDGFLEPQMPVVPDPDTLDEFHPPGSQGARVLIRLNGG
jgi:acyl-coenzyme A thioesterase PaaI-like protein